MARTGRFGPGGFQQGRVFEEKQPGPDPAFFNLPSDSVLVGFFQSPSYFHEIKDAIRAELSPCRIALEAQSQAFEERIRKGVTVALHVRRGDYVRIPSTRCVDESYYQQAIRYFRERFTDIGFCVFSDDIVWCRQQFQDSDFFHCDLRQGTKDPLHDLRLMSSCAHHIIANSSYSWWGAWLNPSESKSVIAPSMWMTGLRSDTVVESTWLKI